MKKFKPILRCVIFLTGLIVIMGVIDFACVQTGYVNYILRNVCVKNIINIADRKSTRLNSSHVRTSRMPSSA